MGDTGQWTHTCQAARCVFGLLVGLPTCGPPVARKKTAGAPPLSSSLPRGHSSLSLSASAFFPSGDDRGEWRRPCQFFVGRFASRQGMSAPSLPFLSCWARTPEPPNACYLYSDLTMDFTYLRTSIFFSQKLLCTMSAHGWFGWIFVFPSLLSRGRVSYRL